MKKIDKATMFYMLGLIAVSTFVLIMLYGILTSGNFLMGTEGELNIDGEDFTPVVSLFASGVNSFAKTVQVFSGMLWALAVSLIVTLIIRRIKRNSIQNKTMSNVRVITLCIGIVGLIIGFFISSFNMIDVVCMIYLPVPITSLISYTWGRLKSQS